MLDLFQIADSCQGLGAIVILVKKVVSLIQWGIPIILILFGTIDLGKAVISSDEKEVKAAQSRLIKRIIYGVAVFFIVLIITVVMNFVADGVAADKGNDADTSNWAKCWKNPK